MIRTPLKRKTRIKQVSDKRADWNARYRAECDRDADTQQCAATGAWGRKSDLERHHPYGRLNERIMIYFYLTRLAHRIIEDNSVRSREQGWIMNERAGYPPNPNQPKPWADKLPIKKS